MSDKVCHQWHSSIKSLANEISIELEQNRQKIQQQSQRLPRHKHLNDDAATALSNDDSVISSFSQKWYDKIVHHYNESHRAYHNLIHVEDILSSIDVLLDVPTTTTTKSTTSPDNNHNHPSMMEKSYAIFTLAAFFHDAIYNPKSSTNEKDSANLFLEFVSELITCVVSATTSTLGKEWKKKDDYYDYDIRQSIHLLFESKNTMITHIKQCILATATHISSANQARQSNNYIVATFLDADMSILGRDSIQYDKYAASIRKEYEFVEKTEYCEKRAEILESFLPLMMNTDEADAITMTSKTKEKQHYYIYATDMGRLLWEDRARLNLRREIDTLRRGVIPCES